MELSQLKTPPENEINDEGFVVRPTELGMFSAQMQLADTPEGTALVWENLPPLYWSLELPELKPAARVLAEKVNSAGGRSPLFVANYVGSGKVLFHATDETWRWRFQVGDAYFARYWVQATRYLSRSKLLDQDRSARLTSDRREYRLEDPVRLRVRFSDERSEERRVGKECRL